MKISKKQLRRLINEMYEPGPGVDLAQLDNITIAHQNIMRDIEDMYAETGVTAMDDIEELRDLFTELLFPLFSYAEGGSGAPRN